MKKLFALLMTGMLVFTSTSHAEDAGQSTYPLSTCVVSGEPLGSMGKAYVFTHEGKEVKLCCKRCLKKFNADPAKYMKEIEAAQKSKTN